VDGERKLIVAERRVQQLIPELFRAARLEHLSRPLQTKIKELPSSKGLFLWGSPGVGKSYAMAAIMRHLIFRGGNVTRVAYEMLCLEIRDTYKPGSTKTELGVINPLIQAGNVFVEDLGTTVSCGAQESDFSLRTFLVLLDKRLENCKATFITSNRSVEQLAKSFDQRIASRLQQACEVVHLTGEDRRTQAAK
jgi:DNA replication protein DnaC